MIRATRTTLLAGLLLTLAAPAFGQFTIGIDPPGYVPGGGPGVGVSTFGYGAYGPRGYGYYTPLPDLGYYNSGGGPSPAFSPIFNALPAAPRDRGFQTYNSYSIPPGGRSPVPISAPPPGSAARERRGLLGRMFGRR